MRNLESKPAKRVFQKISGEQINMKIVKCFDVKAEL